MLTRNKTFYFLGFVMLMTTGCATSASRRESLNQEWGTLERIRLRDLSASQTPEGVIEEGQNRDFDLSDGLSMNEAAALALEINPSIQAVRQDKGIARGQLAGAGLIPNPDIEIEWISPLDSEEWSGKVSAVMDLTGIIVMRGSKRKRAKIHMKEVHWEVADKEWQLIHDVHLAFTDVAYLREALELNEQQEKVADRTLKTIKARHARGATSELNLVLAQAEVAEIKRQSRGLVGQEKLAAQHLNMLLGLSPDHVTKLQIPDKPLAYIPLEGEVSDLALHLRERRPDLLAAEQAYLGTAKELDLAKKELLPQVRVGPSYERGEGGDARGIDASVEFPLFSWNQGEIKTAKAEREKQKQLYLTAVHRARSQYYSAWTQTETLDAEIKYYFDNVAPRLDRALVLSERSFKQGEVDLLHILALQRQVLQSKREILEKLSDFKRSQIEIRRASGPDGRDEKR